MKAMLGDVGRERAPARPRPAGPCSASSARSSGAVERHAGRQARLDMGVVGVLGGGVDDE